MKKIGIENWSDLSKKFDEADLLLGNGFSINLGHFHYTSLFGEFLKSVNYNERAIFRSFRTNNFELIQENLLSAKIVNKLFHIRDTKGDIDKAIDTLKKGLVKSIHNNHPVSSQINWNQLRDLSLQLNNFKDIYTLNYDLFLYHILMQMKDEAARQKNDMPYSDYFWGGEPEDQYKYFVDYDDYHDKHIFYLHGALFIFKRPPDTCKLIRSGDSQELVTEIGDAISNGRMPLFVSEATYKEKRKTIERSDYLSFCYKNLELSKNKLVIFGSSLSAQDAHIVKAINYKKKDIRELAIAIHIGAKSRSELDMEIKRFLVKFNRHKIYFFDSETIFKF